MDRARARRVAPLALVLALAGPLAGAAPARAASAGGPLTSTGAAVTGAVSRVDAPTVAEGVRLDTLGGVGGPRQTLYYTVHRERADSTLHVSVSTPLTGESDQVGVTLLDAQGRSCASDSDSGFGSSNGTALIAASVAIPRSRDASDLACAAAGDFVVQVDHGYHGSTTSGRRADVAVELRIREEPPVEDVESLPETATTPAWRDPVLAAAKPAVGGTALNAATVIGSGAYSGSIRTGESQVFAVPVDFGQSLAAAARVSVPQTLGRLLSAGASSPTLSVQLLSPSRLDAAGASDFASDAADHARGDGYLSSSSDGKVVYEFTDTVSYRNRFAISEAAQGAAERGRYLVVVSLLDRGGDGRRVTVPFVLGIGVRGQSAHSPKYTADDTTRVDDAQTGAGAGDLLRHVAGGVVVGVGALAVLIGIVLLLVVIRRRTALR